MNFPASHPIPSLPPVTRESRPTVTVVICTRNHPRALRSCLEAVHRLDPQPDDLLVVDNSGGDPDTRTVADEFQARYICEPIQGLSRARNRALNESSSEIIAFLDDDAVPTPAWLDQILVPFADPLVASVTGETIAPDAVTPAQPCPSRVVSQELPQWFEMANFGGLGFGTNMALRRRFCTGWKVFDERLGRGTPLWIAEESHAFAQLISRGYRAVHVPAAIVLHPEKPRDISKEATTAFGYWLLLFWEFPGHKLDLLRFISRRIGRKPLKWPRNPQEPGEVIKSGWRMYLKAGFGGTLLYLRSRRRIP
ncbi:MAG TPA: glycosyltransferase family 2 protein [Terracidiphilus sp.]|nr:glycosyltransferase family 2 protein [Terracidiphilus sp.]